MNLRGGVVLLRLQGLMLRGSFVGGGERVLPLGVVEHILAAVELLGKGAVTLGGFSLFFQFFHLPRKFVLQIAQPLQMLAGVFQTAFGFLAAFFVFGHARRLFDIGAQFFGTRFDNARNHALFDHGIAARAHTRAEKEVGDVAAAHGLIVDVVGGFALPRELAFDAHFGILPPRSLQGVVGVVEHQFHRGARRGAAGGRAIENHVLHTLAAKLLGRRFAQHPAHRVDHIRFAAAVGADHGNKLAGNMYRGGVGKGFEAGEFDVGQAHGRKDAGGKKAAF